MLKDKQTIERTLLKYVLYYYIRKLEKKFINKKKLNSLKQKIITFFEIKNQKL